MSISLWVATCSRTGRTLTWQALTFRTRSLTIWSVAFNQAASKVNQLACVEAWGRALIRLALVERKNRMEEYCKVIGMWLRGCLSTFDKMTDMTILTVIKQVEPE